MSFLFRYLRFHDIIGGIHVPVDDGVDKLNRKYTLLVFLFLALPIFTKQYIGEPIECFAPVYFAEHQSRYINSYCWTQSTYYMVPVGDPEDDGDQQEPPDRIMPDEVDYFIGFETVTHIGNERLRRVRVNYYRWAPLILLAQGLCFYIPFLICNSCSNNAGVKLRRLLKKASDIASLPPGCQQREALLAEFVDQFHTLVTGEAGWCADLQCGMGGAGGESNSSSLISGSSSGSGPQPPVQTSQPSRGGGGGRGHANNHQANHSTSNQDDTTTRGDHRGRHHGGNSGCCLGSIPIIGNLLACCLKPCASFGLVGPSKYLSLLYLAVKTAYVLNVGLQFFLLGQFLGRGYLKHGIELLNRLIINGEWWASPRFPLSTLCQVRADMSGGLRSYTCQCVLPINVFNEKIFSVVWFYMAFLLPLNVLSLLFWIYRTFEANRLSYIRLCLWRTRLVELNQIHRTVRRLSQSYLGWDGVFLLRLIEHNHGSIMATLIMSRLWEFYANQMKLQEDANQLALANNAQYTLAQTTTAISNQHQMMMAAAAAAAQQPNPQQQVGGGGGGHGPGGHAHPNGHPNQGGHGHGFVGGQGGGHGHGGQQPLMPTGNGHGGGGHSHGPIHPAAAMVHGQPLAPMVPHGPHGHHAGQINQPGGHHPLHAANTHAHNHKQPLHLNAFANATNASLLAQLQQQHHHHQQQQQQQQQHQHQTSGQNPNQQNQQSAPGNVAAAVAALAAAAAANHSSNANAAKVAALGTAVSNAQAAAAAVAAQANSSNKPNLLSKGPQLVPVLQQTLGKTGGSGANNNNNSNNNSNQISSSSNANTNTNNNSTTKASSATTSFITNPTGGQVVAPGGPPLPPPPPAHVVAAVAAAAGVPGVQQNLLGSASGPGSASVRPNGQQQQQVSSGSGGRPMQQQQQPTNANSNNNPALNLRSSNIQAAAVAAASDGQGKFSPHTIKRT